MIEVKNVTKQYGQSNRKAIDNVSLNIKEGQIYGFLGPNGAGKSTLIKCMLGVIPFQTGNIKIGDYDIVSKPIEAKMQIGFVPDNHVIYERLTGRQYVNFVCNIYNVSPSEQEERLKKYVELFQFENYIDAPISTYSHGTKQKISVIGALIHNPKVWILDEPMTGLDPRSSFILKKLMRDHADKGNVVFFSSHVLEVVEKLCDRIAIINDGKLIGEYSIDEIDNMKNDNSLEEFFLNITNAIDDVSMEE